MLVDAFYICMRLVSKLLDTGQCQIGIKRDLSPYVKILDSKILHLKIHTELDHCYVQTLYIHV